MGFDTYLQVGDRTALMWRKSVSSMPRLLFRHDQKHIKAVQSPDNPMHAFEVEYRATAAEVLETLAEGGLGLDSSVAAYGTIRQSVIAEIELKLHETFLPELLESKDTATKTGGSNDEGEQLLTNESDLRADKSHDDAVVRAREVTFERKREVFRAQSPETDLTALGKLLAIQWLDSNVEEVAIFEDLIYDSPISATYSFVSDIMRSADQHELDQYAVGRAVESFGVLYGEAPLLAWPLLVCTLPKHLPPETPVSYVMTEDAHQHDVASEEETNAYLESYWLSSAEGLVSQASTLGRLFGVLASFDSKLGREFWFARAAEALASLDRMIDARDEHSTKARGDSLEELFDALLRTEEPELSIAQKNFRTTEEEIDFVLTNGLVHAFWSAQSSPLVSVECKNWSSPVGVKELRIFESKMRDRGAICRIGIFVSMEGFTEPALVRLKTPQRDLGVIFAVTGDDLRDLVAKKIRLTDWLRTEGAIRALGK